MRFWKYVKQLGVVLAVLLAGLQVWDWVIKPSQKLEAEIQYGPFVLPPQVEAQFAKNQAVAFGPWIAPLVERTLTEDGISEKSIPRMAIHLNSEVQRHLRDALTLQLPPSVSGLHGFWRAAVRNGGSQPLQGVRLVLPLSAFVIVEREGSAPVQRDVDSVIDLETVHPHEFVRVTAWAKSEPFHPTDETVRLTHASGTGTVSFQQPVGAVGQFVDRYWPPLLFTLPLLFVFLLSFLERVSSSPPTKRRSRDTSQDQASESNDG